MKVTSSAIKNGAFEDKYGKRGTQFSPNGMPTYSIPFEISDVPTDTKSFAVVLEDKDAITASGFVWIHWLNVALSVKMKAKVQRIMYRAQTRGQVHWEISIF